MEKPKEPVDEQERINELESYQLLDTLPEEDYDNLTAIAAQICNTKISLVSLIDDHRQWFKSNHGLAVRETPKDVAFCAHAINNPEEIMIVKDAREDERFFDNPLVTDYPHVIFYAGVPLVGKNGYPLGTLCVIDELPKSLTDDQILSLKSLAKQVVNLFELSRTNSKLNQALHFLEEKNKDLENFALLAAHDLKSPLNNIQSLTEILIDAEGSKMDESSNHMLNLIHSSSKTLRHLVDGMLEYSRSYKILLESKVNIPIKDIQDEIISLYEGQENTQIFFNTALKYLFVNKTAIEQILINLISNAIKYGNKEVNEIEIGVFLNDKGYLFSVKDNGPGIPPEDHEKIFALFETLGYNGNKSGEKSHGIGLATVHRLVTAMKGTITIESIPKSSTTFIIQLPIL